MAGLLDALYLVLAVGIGVIGLAVVMQRVSDTARESRWKESGVILIALLFLLALGVEFLA
jgi:hypothetical protein